MRKIVHWSLVVLTAAYLVTGFGITHYQLVEKLTLGLLTKNLAFQLHLALTWPFIALLALHVYFTLGKTPGK
jgi:hypothetical protein